MDEETNLTIYTNWIYSYPKLYEWLYSKSLTKYAIFPCNNFNLNKCYWSHFVKSSTCYYTDTDNSDATLLNIFQKVHISKKEIDFFLCGLWISFLCREDDTKISQWIKFNNRLNLHGYSWDYFTQNSNPCVHMGSMVVYFSFYKEEVESLNFYEYDLLITSTGWYEYKHHQWLPVDDGILFTNNYYIKVEDFYLIYGTELDFFKKALFQWLQCYRENKLPYNIGFTFL